MSLAKVHPRREQLAAFVRGQLSDAEQSAVASHVEACDACCAALREIPDDGFLERIRAAHTPVNAGDDSGELAARKQAIPEELSQHPRYQVGRRLGAGGMGVVYKAEHKLMGRPVALKVIHRDLIRNPRIVERFHQEVKAAARLSHPNIVAAYDADQAGDAHFLVMEFVDGISLARLVERRGQLDVALACNFIRQACKGLQHAYEAGMVHRDIKPHNLMLTRKGQIKILDFGLARMASESRAELDGQEHGGGPGLTRFGDIMGTPDFMAPEQLLDPSQADIRADLYSLGCTLYFLLTAQSPFPKAPPRKVLLAKKYRPPRPITELRPDLPAELVAVINQILAREPSQRYETPAELSKALAPFVKPAASSPNLPLEAPTAKPAAVVERSEPAPPAAPRGDGFLAHCPFCNSKLRIPNRGLGASLPCPHCGSYFTAVPAGGMP